VAGPETKTLYGSNVMLILYMTQVVNTGLVHVICSSSKLSACGGNCFAAGSVIVSYNKQCMCRMPTLVEVIS